MNPDPELIQAYKEEIARTRRKEKNHKDMIKAAEKGIAVEKKERLRLQGLRRKYLRECRQ